MPLWGRWEGEFTAQAAADPAAALVLVFTSPAGRAVEREGFWDGGSLWRARFMPDEEGEWRYATRSTPPVEGLHGRTGAFHVKRAADPGGQRRSAQPGGQGRFLRHGALRVAGSRTHLAHADGTPFFWLGDTVWNGTLLSSPDDWERYLADRAGKRFSVVQFNALAPWRTAPADAEGQVAFTGRQDIRLDARFFQRMDARMAAIEARGLLAAPVLIWSLTDKDPGKYLPEKDVVRLVRYQVARYGAHHVLWILAGDNPYRDESAERWRRVGREVFGGRAHAPVTTHPTGMNWPWDSWRDEAWLDVLGYQSGHGDSPDTLRWIHSGPPSRAWRETPAKPIINLEPPYEAHRAYQSRQPHSDSNVRRAVWWSLLSAPMAGVTYGGHGVWSWHTAAGEEPTDHRGTGPARPWHEALSLPGSRQMQHVAELVGSIRWWSLRPDPGLLASQPGGDDPARFVAAARSGRGDLAVLYLPAGGEVKLREGALLQGHRVEWFDPRTGARTAATTASPGVYQAPSGEDWVLLLRQEER